MKRLIVTVDTEEEGLWGGNYRVTGNTTDNLRGLPRFQAVCERLGVPPTYLIDAPVTADQEAMRDLRRWQEAGTCEVGAHCHPWCNPPLPDCPPTSAETYLCNLPVEVQHQKLSWLTDRIASEMGRTPTSYRAGRYGFNDSSAAVLAELGYQVDSSVLPMYEYLAEGGPDFRYCRRDPYRIHTGSTASGIIEIPVTAGFSRPDYDRRRKLWIGLRAGPLRRLRVAGVADRLGFARRVKLTPEGTRIANVRALIDACVTDGLNCLVLMLHSSSLRAGLSPYTATEEDLELFYQRLNQMITHAVTEHGIAPATLTAVAGELAKDGQLNDAARALAGAG
ncbi:polysaccharide deacetylase family protein [Roseiconus nitratireducens]|uniref:Polysaccharide deacetylase family protein n=1 Tax=Roseiconus nitratireducens TaxID=2605748 RepID=A0A5M6DFI5_9BACT|nr:polysaccharide deacetylase family protein [Roseiconus nitratireducens]KAA5546268.1 polysaccharide deacetylase family protein [Roseiconus nitratireducens]